MCVLELSLPRMLLAPKIVVMLLSDAVFVKSLTKPVITKAHRAARTMPNSLPAKILLQGVLQSNYSSALEYFEFQWAQSEALDRSLMDPQCLASWAYRTAIRDTVDVPPWLGKSTFK